MKAERDPKTGKWLIQYRYTDWQGKRRKSTKRGFQTKREAEEWLRNFLMSQRADFNMKFKDFIQMYYNDMETRLREHTMRTKKYIIELKIIPYFGEKPVNQIRAADIRQWQNELMKQGYAPTYLKTINNQLSAIFNYAVRYYDLAHNPCSKAGSMGKSKADEMDFWTQEEFNKFIDCIMDKRQSYMAFMILFCTGMRIGELLALTPADIDLEQHTITVRMMLSHIEALHGFRYARQQLCDVAFTLEKKISIPQVKQKISLIKEINTDAFWDVNSILAFENVRKELRELMKFLVENDEGKKSIVTSLKDPILDEKEGIQLDAAYDFEDYRKKVNRYVEEHKDSIAIYKLTHNKQLEEGDYKELERVLTQELGSKEDYQREFGDIPFGLLIRQIAKLDHDAAMLAFSEFINDASLNQKQIQFIYKIINHIEQNGYMENVVNLQKPPFDKPVPFIKLFDAKTRNMLLQTINEIKDNAVNIIA